MVMFGVLGTIVGGAMYLWLVAWAALRFGGWVDDKTGSMGLNFGAYWLVLFTGIGLPVAICVGLST
jgi:hypothetical protein